MGRMDKGAAGSAVEAYNTDSYGNTLIFTGPGADNTWFTDDDTQSSYGANGIIYQGRALDAESALYYFRTRYYSPALGRFTNRNPWGYIQGRQNLYDFEKESPTRYVEPLSAAVAVAVDVLLGVTVLAVVTLAVARSRHVPIRIPGGAICGEPPDPCPGLRTAFAPAMAKYARAAVAAVKAEISFQNEAWVYEAQGTYAVHLDLVQAAQEGAAQAYLAALKAYQSLEEQGC